MRVLSDDRRGGAARRKKPIPDARLDIGEAELGRRRCTFGNCDDRRFLATASTFSFPVRIRRRDRPWRSRA
jgi:hypothetical protein